MTSQSEEGRPGGLPKASSGGVLWRNRWWLVPLVAVALLLVILLVLAGADSEAPFQYDVR